MESMMGENYAFTDKVIAGLQRRTRVPVADYVLTSYLLRLNRLAWDEPRKLIWVIPPKGNAELAVWLMNVINLYINHQKP